MKNLIRLFFDNENGSLVAPGVYWLTGILIALFGGIIGAPDWAWFILAMFFLSLCEITYILNKVVKYHIEEIRKLSGLDGKRKNNS